MNAKIFLVDDEQPVLDGLSVIITKFIPELTICGTARSGKVAIEAIQQTHPDIIIMDIRMPGMSGIDVLKELDRLGLECLTILLTAYERFDIAQEACGLGVYNYLVKPVEQDIFIKILKNALLHIQKRKERTNQAVNALELLRLARPILEESFLFYLLLGDSSKIQITTYAQIFGWNSSEKIYGHCAVIASRQSLQYEECIAIQTEISNHLNCLSGKLFNTYIMLFIPGNNTEHTNTILKYITNKLVTMDLVYNIGPPKQLAIASQSLLEAFLSLPDFQQKNEHEETLTLQLIKKMIQEISLKNYSATALFIGLQQIVNQQTTFTAFSDRRILLALRFIEANYGKQISLEDTAQAVDLSPAYLSRLLVTETGKSFIEHLTKYRMDRACKELAKGQYSIKEIAAICGYPDSNYFSRIFKKHIGQTPSEFAEQCGRILL
ncbi:response regulator transcription factor [Gracilinema caldarium]|uniref:Two component transcriptional regulator, AraC family n=1 Tax=Gracilinema caldarium (strain ATCC 51460 / DSM 7334 / H1) TaxID=744872 RepID=F8F3Q5_GRAC1|nr:helix-turn-helix domain-containing protein [Gracilinema caldarium]AEJ19999.1 two component transcriptional regulator, AraC family [Gracilinema caldarium DSM 7334]